jgi:hypothetical protein
VNTIVENVVEGGIARNCSVHGGPDSSLMYNDLCFFTTELKNQEITPREFKPTFQNRSFLRIRIIVFQAIGKAAMGWKP